MAQVDYAVEFIEEAWCVRLRGRTFGPYSAMSVAVTAAARAARKAELQGYTATVIINGGPEADPDSRTPGPPDPELHAPR